MITEPADLYLNENFIRERDFIMETERPDNIQQSFSSEASSAENAEVNSPLEAMDATTTQPNEDVVAPEAPAGPQPLMKAGLPLPLVGRVNDSDIFDLGEYYLKVFTDRVNVFGTTMPYGLLDKGRFCAQITSFWLQKTRHTLLNTFKQLITEPSSLDDYLDEEKRFEYPDYLAERSIVFKKAEPLPVEAEVWGFLTGPAWKEYRDNGTVFGKRIINGLLESQSIPGQVLKLTKITGDGSIVDISDAELSEITGEKIAREIKEKSIAIYNQAQRYSRIPAGFYIANMKIGFGLINGKLEVNNDLLSPENACYWDMRGYRVGRTHYSYELQSLKAWLLQTSWNKNKPFPNVPPEIVEQSTRRYKDLCERIKGIKKTG